MPTFSYLPGTQVTTLDGGLLATTIPSTKSTLIVGFSGIGPTNEPYQVINRATAAGIFGLSGSLIKAMEECALGGNDNIILFRAGTTDATLSGVGLDTTVGTTSPGFSIDFSSVASTTATDYSIWYKAGILYVYLSGQLVYANDPTNDNVIDSGNITITGSVAGQHGLFLGASASTNGYNFANAITLAQAAALTGTTTQPMPVYVAPVTGVGLTGRQTFLALAEALDLLSVYPTDQVYLPDAVLDQPNVAFYVESNAATATNNPATNPNALDWLSIIPDGEGGNVYQWASSVINSDGATVTAMTGVTTAAERLAAGFYEVNYPTLIGNFCYLQEFVGLQGTCIGFLGTNGPVSFGLVDTRNWIGFLPTYSLTNASQAITAGKGLLGNPYLAGAPSTSLNILCNDYANGYRIQGFFLTSTGAYDGVIQYDANNNPVDIGAYIHCFADQAIVSDGYATNYVTNLIGIVGGLHSTLDEQVALTNKSVNVIQLWKPNNAQMDSLTEIGISVLRFKGANNLPALLHGQTIANPNSDYINLLRQDIKGLVVDTTRQVADGFIGYAATDLLSLSALQTALSNKFLTLQKTGYISSYTFTVTSTTAGVRLGHASIQITFAPANELVQLSVQVGATLPTS